MQGVKLPSSVIPLHHQLYLSLRQRLLDGGFPKDSPLPGELRLAEELGVSRVTVRRTLETLQNEGLVVRRHGVGTFPAVQLPTPPSARAGSSYSDHVYSTSRHVRHELLEYEYVRTPHFLDSAEDQFGAVVLKTVRLGFVRKEPAHLVTGFTPERFGRLIDRTKLSDRPIMEMLEKGGVSIDRTELFIGACAATHEDAERLAIPIGSALIRSDRVSLHQGRPVDHDLILSRPDLFRYSFVSDEETGTLRPGSGQE